MKICLKVPMNEIDCARRNALSEKIAGLALQKGMVGTFVEIFDNGESYMVEFNDPLTGRCQWLGLLSRSEIEFVTEIARAA